MKFMDMLKVNSRQITFAGGGTAMELSLEDNQVIVVSFTDGTTEIVGHINRLGGICDDCLELREVAWWKIETVNIERQTDSIP